ncbi:MAG TPA: Nif3-like dinuclear metal center hexameric protein [Pirellulales bacterium]|jgi:dinuclear metal center YbgI/SA1388 family protein|nr:Nif3-like dinuclear metal center hexameric protein [Pirellulales bacterium]
MSTIADVAAYLERFAPARLAAEWDNVGLLVGDRQCMVTSIMTCLTVTPDVVAEATRERANLIITHHPFPFRATKRITTDTNEGRMLLNLMAAGIAVYSPHTAFDSAAEGINQRLATGLGLINIAPLAPDRDDPAIGTGRYGGTGGVQLGELARRGATFLKINGVQVVGEPSQTINRVAIACGSGGELLDVARRAGCDCFVTGETRFHTCLEAQAAGIALVLTGHYASERFAVEALAESLQREFPPVKCRASLRERDPLNWFTLTDA